MKCFFPARVSEWGQTNKAMPYYSLLSLLFLSTQAASTPENWSFTVQCPEAVAPVNGSVTENNSTATYSCNTGYELVGESTRTCESNGTWSSAEPNCKPCIHACMMNRLLANLLFHWDKKWLFVPKEMSWNVTFQVAKAAGIYRISIGHDFLNVRKCSRKLRPILSYSTLQLSST